MKTSVHLTKGISKNRTVVELRALFLAEEGAALGVLWDIWKPKY